MKKQFKIIAYTSHIFHAADPIFLKKADLQIQGWERCGVE